MMVPWAGEFADERASCQRCALFPEHIGLKAKENGLQAKGKYCLSLS